MTTAHTTAFSPTVSVTSYVSVGASVDQFNNAPFSPTASIVNLNLQTLTSFDFTNSYYFSKQATKGYFGDFIMNYDPGFTSPSLICSMVITTTPEFYPYGNLVGLPLSCRINGIRFPCSYTLAPFEITITELDSTLSGNNIVVNITT